jgi:hypothetical protein
MPIHEERRIFAEPRNAAWISVHVTHEGETVKTDSRQPEFLELRGDAPYPHLFENAARDPMTFSERFPRLTVAMIAIALVAFTVTVEIEYLHVAGYYWR